MEILFVILGLIAFLIMGTICRPRPKLRIIKEINLHAISFTAYGLQFEGEVTKVEEVPNDLMDSYRYLFMPKQTPKSSFCDPNCHYLIPNEETQTHKKEHHMCTKYNVRVIHGGYFHHPNIFKCEECTNG